MSRKKKLPEVLPPITTGSLPIQEIESAVLQVAQTRGKTQVPQCGTVRRAKLRFLNDNGGKTTRVKDKQRQ